MWELFLFGGLVFWLVTAVYIAIIIAWVENEKEFAAIVTIGTYLLYLHFLAGVHPLAYLREHPGTIAAAIGIYFGAGVVWGVLKWVVACRKAVRRYNDLRDEWMRTNKIQGTEVPDDRLENWKDYYRRHFEYGGNVVRIPINAREHRGRIMRWMGFWPFSILWTLLDDVVTKIWRELYELLRGTFQRIADMMTGSAARELAKEVTPSMARESRSRRGHEDPNDADIPL